MNRKNKKIIKTHPILFLTSLIVFVFLFSSPSWATERDALMLKARQTSWKGNYDAAAAIYQQLINENPKDIEALIGLATVLSWQKKYKKSEAIYQQVRDMRPDIPDGEIGLLRLKAWQGDHTSAEKGLKALLSKYPAF